MVRRATASRPDVAVFLPSLGGGGAQRMMVHLVNEFADRSIETELLLVRAEGPYLGQVSDSVRVVDLEASRILTALPRLARYLGGRNPRALLSTLTYANVIAVWAAVVSSWDGRLVVREAESVVDVGEFSFSLKERLVPFFVRHVYPSADAVIAISSSMATDLVDLTGMPARRVHTIPNPVVTETMDERAEEPLEHPWLSAEGTTVVLGVGRLEPEKDFPTLVRAFFRVREERDARLIILGEGREREKLESLARQAGREDEIWMPGFVGNPYKFMKRASIFVQASRWEGFGNALVEAMYFGIPVVATDCPTGPSEILEGGRWGSLVPVGDPHAMADAIVGALQEPVDHEGLRRRAKQFNQIKVADSYLDVLLGPS